MNRVVRILGVFALWFLYSLSSLISNKHETEKPVSSKSRQEDDYFELCGKKIFLKDLPFAMPDDDAPFGVRNWKRDLGKAIIIDHRTDAEGVQLYGRTGNHIIEFFHAFDMARDRGGALILRENGFPIDWFLKDLYLGIDGAILEEKFGIILYDHIMEGKDRSNLTLMATPQLYHYVSEDPSFNLDDVMMHRHYVIQWLYRITAEDLKLHPNSPGAASMCASLHALYGEGNDNGGNKNRLKELGMKDVTKKYTVIHARTLEGFGTKFLNRAHEVFGVDSRVGKEYPPELISSILAPLGMGNNSILMITDGKNPHVVNQLSSDPAIGPNFQLIPSEVSTVAGDLMLAILSDVFIGNPVSTFSQYIVQVRYALGIGNSFLFAKKGVEDEWETFCGNDVSCFYEWQKLWIPQF